MSWAAWRLSLPPFVLLFRLVVLALDLDTLAIWAPDLDTLVLAPPPGDFGSRPWHLFLVAPPGDFIYPCPWSLRLVILFPTLRGTVVLVPSPCDFGTLSTW